MILTKADDVPEIEENPVIKLGDLIELGHNYQHRLLCKSSTTKVKMLRLMDGEKGIWYRPTLFNRNKWRL